MACAKGEVLETTTVCFDSRRISKLNNKKKKKALAFGVVVHIHEVILAVPFSQSYYILTRFCFHHLSLAFPVCI